MQKEKEARYHKANLKVPFIFEKKAKHSQNYMKPQKSRIYEMFLKHYN